MASSRLVKLNSRIKQAFQNIEQISDKAVGEFAGDISKMAAQLYRDKTKHKDRSTGQLAGSVHVVKEGDTRYAVVNKAFSKAGSAYGAPEEFGWKRPKGKKAGKKVKGKQAIIRATFGMIKRWQRGERWRD